MSRSKLARTAIWGANALLAVGAISVASSARGGAESDLPTPPAALPRPEPARTGAEAGDGVPTSTEAYALLWAGLEPPKKAPPKKDPEPKKDPKVYAMFLLTGTIVAPDTEPAAFIRYNDGGDKAYMVGDYLGGWMVASITERHVVLRRGDQKAVLKPRAPLRLEVGKNRSPAEAFRFEDMDMGPDLGVVSRASAPALGAGADVRPAVSHGELSDEEIEAERKRRDDLVIPPPRDREYSVKPKVMQYVRTRLPKLKRQVRFAMHQTEGGGYDGVAVAHVQPGSIWDKYGLCTGDIIREADGKPIKSPAAVLALYHAVFSKASDVKEIDLVVERQGKMMQRLYRFDREAAQ